MRRVRLRFSNQGRQVPIRLHIGVIVLHVLETLSEFQRTQVLTLNVADEAFCPPQVFLFSVSDDDRNLFEAGILRRTAAALPGRDLLAAIFERNDRRMIDDPYSGLQI